MKTKEDLMAILEYFIMEPDAKESWKDDKTLSGDLNPRWWSVLFFFTVSRSCVFSGEWIAPLN